MTIKSNASVKQSTKPAGGDDHAAPAKKAVGRPGPGAVAVTTVRVRSTRSAVSQGWPDPPTEAVPPLAAETPMAVRRKQKAAVMSSAAPTELDAESSVLAHVPPPRPQKTAKPPKLKKPKPVRDSFTMPKGEYQLIDLLKQRASAKQRHVKKSEILRAGILALANMTDAQLFAALDQVPVIKTGRPRSEPES